MYRRPKFLELLLEIRREMAHEADYDVDLFVEIARHGGHCGEGRSLSNGDTPKTEAPPPRRQPRVSKT